MKNSIVVATLAIGLLAVTASPTRATEVGSARNFGIGFQVGSPTAIVGKLFLGPANALDFGVGFGDRNNWGRCRFDDGRRHDCAYWGDHVSFHADYLWQDNIVRGTAKLDWHIGVGGRLLVWDNDYDDRVGAVARMPLGLDLTFNRPDFLEVFFEIAPGLMIVPRTRFGVDVGIGVRFYP